MSFFKRYWEGLSERKQAGIRYAGNIAVLVLTVWVTVSVVSYVFTWKQDQSALSGVGVVENAAAKSGLSAGHFLVTESFGLAAFCVVLFLLVWTKKCLWSACPANLKKWFFGMLSLSFLLSWALAFAGRFLNLEYAFGGGLGGRAGAALVNWSVFQLGEVVSICILAALFIVWMYCMSRRFSDLLMGKKRVKPVTSESSLSAEDLDASAVAKEIADAPADASQVPHSSLRRRVLPPPLREHRPLILRAKRRGHPARRTQNPKREPERVRKREPMKAPLPWSPTTPWSRR